jgi:hypothetical protein
VEAGTGRVKVGMSELEMLLRPAGKSWNWNRMLFELDYWNLLRWTEEEMTKESLMKYNYRLFLNIIIFKYPLA